MPTLCQRLADRTVTALSTELQEENYQYYRLVLLASMVSALAEYETFNILVVILYLLLQTCKQKSKIVYSFIHFALGGISSKCIAESFRQQ